ncbi:S23 ribosomal protein [Calothrix parasitica NIES-267]|uniref:S23 ribosomal protein n=1 Tax=Calothrix parasitica NIES-267 TaxID=1973488 RepID=A0A1Z4LKE3_9CYAN|nr:S23 ribosomal protein [Calothrix parasitica NIES-267]
MLEKEKGKKYFRTHEDLAIFQLAFETAMQIYDYSKRFPVEEKYSLTDPSGSQSLMGETPKNALSHQVRRSSRSVCANFAEAWRKRRYKAAFVAKLSDCESEAAETQVWLKFAVKCHYLTVEQGRELYGTYNQILSGLVKMIKHPENWLLN